MTRGSTGLHTDDAHVTLDRAMPEPAHITVPDHELIRLIGRGSYGEVWLARNITGKGRAVKIVRRDALGDARPYEREFAAIQRYEPVSTRADGLVNVLHIGRAPDNRCFYYVMELADAVRTEGEAPTGSTLDDAAIASYRPRTLRDELQLHGRLSLDSCVMLARELAGALRALHSAGLVHRDIKPSNIIFIRGAPKLADIGLVGELGETRSFVGTEGYIPPEGPGGTQADLFSLAMVLYEAMTGLEVNRFPEVPRDWLKRGAREMSFFKIIARAGEFDVTRRFQSADELLRDVATYASGGEPASARNSLSWKIAAAVLLIAAGAWAAWHKHERGMAMSGSVVPANDWRNAERLLHEGRHDELRPLIDRIASMSGGKENARDVAVRMLADMSINGEPVRRLIASPPAVRTQVAAQTQTVAVSNELGVIALGSPSGLELLNIADGSSISRLSNASTLMAVFSPEGRTLFSCSPLVEETAAGLHCWTLMRDLTGSLDPRDDGILGRPVSTRHLSISRKTGLLAVVSGTQSNVIIFGPTRTPRVLTASAFSQHVAISDDGSLTAASNPRDKMVRVWHTEDGSPDVELPVGNCTELAFASAANLLVIGTKETITAYNSDSWTVKWTKPRDSDMPRQSSWMIVNADGDALLTPFGITDAALLRVSDGELLMRFTHPQGWAPTAADFAKTGRWLAIAYGREPVHLWNVDVLRERLRQLDIDW